MMPLVPHSGPIELPDTSARRLALVLVAIAMQKSWENSPQLWLSFLPQFHGRAVRLVQDEQVQCNGQPLTNNDASFDGVVPLAVQGSPNTCLYSQNREDAPVRIDFFLAPLPVILYPQEGETLILQQSLEVVYQAGSGRDIQVRAESTAHAPPLSNPVATGHPQPDTGYYHDFDPSHVGQGPGTLTLSRAFPTFSLARTPFISVQINARCETSLSVKWA